MSQDPGIATIQAPQFCPWCGTPTGFRSDEHTPLFKSLADEKGVEPPDSMEHTLHTDAYVCACAGCRRISHVIAHPPAD